MLLGIFLTLLPVSCPVARAFHTLSTYVEVIRPIRGMNTRTFEGFPS